MATTISKLLNIVLPKRTNPAGTAVTETFNETSSGSVLALPAFREHLTDLFDTRATLDSRSLIQEMFKHDPDMSATVHAFLTMADTTPVFLVRDENRQLDPAGQELLNKILTAFTTRMDYSKGFKIVPSLQSIAESCRYMLLLRGALGAELVISKEFFPTEFRMIDMGKVEWFERAAGQYTPQQTTLSGKKISLDVPQFFATWFRQDPTTIYSYSPFVSAINTIAARQQVINDLYRIMQVTGYPRMEITVLEEVLMKNAPADSKTTKAAREAYLNAQLSAIQGVISSLRPNQAFIHTDSVQTGVMNEKSPAMAIDITSVINTLNSQNQAGLKVMATIIGRGESGVNTASVEARVFSLSAQALNGPIGDLWSQAFTLALRLHGSTSFVECFFQPVEMRSDTELETQKLVRAQRLKEDLSLGLITDEEYHLWVHNRLPPSGVPKLSGTNFQQSGNAGVDVTALSPNGDPVGRAASAPGGNKGARDNKSKVGGK